MTEHISGRILKGLGGLYTVLSDAGETFACRARGVFRHTEQTPTVGDRVLLRRESDGEDDLFIESIGERKNCLIRPPLSNIDIMFITFAAAKPEPALVTIDKLSAICEHNRILPVFIITKRDEAPERAEQLADIYRRVGYEAFPVSAVTNEGTDELRRGIATLLPGKCAAFAGASGVGKSTCMNLLFPDLSLPTGNISRKIERGKHTTRHAELFPVFLGGGTALLADTPGFGLLDFVHFDFFSLENLAPCFAEFYPYIGECRYTKCTHKKEEGCRIVEAVARGEIPASRHESYCQIYEEIRRGNHF